MGGFSGQVLVVLAIVVAVGVLAVLHSLAAAVRNDTHLHDLRIRVNQLRKEQLQRLQRLAERATSQPQPKDPPAEQPQPFRKAA